jgi:hypothetical protein
MRTAIAATPPQVLVTIEVEFDRNAGAVPSNDRLHDRTSGPSQGSVETIADDRWVQWEFHMVCLIELDSLEHDTLLLDLKLVSDCLFSSVRFALF